MNAALGTGDAGVGELQPARPPVRPLQLALACLVAVVGVTGAVLTYLHVAASPVVFAGAVTPAHSYPLNFTTTGTLAAVEVRAGQQVTRGQVLATENTGTARARLASARATIRASQAQLAADRAAGAPAAVIAAVQARLATARAQLLTFEGAVTAATLHAPVAGTVQAVAGAPGTPVGPAGLRGAGSSPAPVVALVSGPLTVTATPPSADVARLHPGERVTLTITGISQSVLGSVSKVTAKTGQQGNTVGYRVVITIVRPAVHLVPGATVTIALG